MITLLEFLLKKHIDIDPEAVDLALPSGTLWCSHNVGADKPEEYGDYFAWGEINPKKEYSWKNYNFGTWNSLTKYNDKDKKTILEPEDDIAHIKMCRDWHMPSKELIQELIHETKNESTTLNGVNGKLFISKKNGNSIFIPAAGWFYINSIDSARSIGCLWSSTLNSAFPYRGYYIDFNYDDIYIGDSNRCYGLSVRGVIHKK